MAKSIFNFFHLFPQDATHPVAKVEPNMELKISYMFLGELLETT
jgi:hypothetical protein